MSAGEWELGAIQQPPTWWRVSAIVFHYYHLHLHHIHHLHHIIVMLIVIVIVVVIVLIIIMLSEQNPTKTKSHHAGNTIPYTTAGHSLSFQSFLT